MTAPQEWSMEALEGNLEDIDGNLDDYVREGFTDFDTIVRHVGWSLSDQPHPPESVRLFVARRLEVALAARAVEVASWPKPTDCDKIDAAFEELEAGGILCRQHFCCCSTCGHRDLTEEAERQRREGVKVRGWVFYCSQTTYTAMEGDGVWLQYRRARGSRSTTLSIGRKAFAVLHTHGLHPNWDDSPDHTIHVPLQWMRRVPMLPFGGKDFPRSYPIPDAIYLAK